MGHSVGELGCAYADGGLTADETVLAAYWRGRCVKEANLPPGAMAAVGLCTNNSGGGSSSGGSVAIEVLIFICRQSFIASKFQCKM